VFFWLEIEVKLKHKEKELEDILNEKKSADTSSEGIMKKSVYLLFYKPKSKHEIWT
jgi:hypothetical protein